MPIIPVPMIVLLINNPDNMTSLLITILFSSSMFALETSKELENESSHSSSALSIFIVGYFSKSFVEILWLSRVVSSF